MILPGLNVQWPWSALLLSGDKTVETRRYPLPLKYVGFPLALIETPGPRGRAEAGILRARVTGVVVFDAAFAYENLEHWGADRARHKVAADSPFAFKSGGVTWGWPVRSVRSLAVHREPPQKRGIVFCGTFEVAGA